MLSGLYNWSSHLVSYQTIRGHSWSPTFISGARSYTLRSEELTVSPSFNNAKYNGFSIRYHFGPSILILFSTTNGPAIIFVVIICWTNI